MALLTDDDVFGAPSASLLSDSDVFGEASPKPKQNSGIVGDIGTALKRGVLQMPGMATGLADIAAAPVSIATGVNRPVSRAADWLGEQTGLQFGKWAEAAGAEYSPEMQQAQQNVEQAKGFFPTLGAVAQNPRVAAQVVAESLPATIAGGLVARGAMGAVAGAEKLAALRAAAGSADAAVANAARRELLKSGAIAAGVGEGAVSAGLQMAQTGYDVDPALAAGTALGAGIGTGVIGGLSGRVAGSALGRRLGLSDIETSMAAGTLGENASKAGIAGAVKRIGAGVVQEGLLEEAPQSYQEQVWQNIAAGKPWNEGAAEAAALGAVAGGVMGGAVNAIPRSAQPAEQPPAVQPIAQELADAARIPDPQVNPVAALNHPASGAIVKATAEGVLSGAIPPNTPATPATTAAPPTAAVVAPPPQGLVAGVPITETTPAAPGSDTPVSTAATSPQTNQAEPAGVPTTGPTADASDQAQVAVPPAQGSEAQPATGAVAGEVRQGIASAAIPPLQYPKQTASIAGPLPQTATAMPVGRFGAPVQQPKKPAQKFVRPTLTARAQPSETSVLPQTAAQMPVGRFGERAKGVEAPKLYAGLTAEEAANLASRHGQDYDDALRKIVAKPGAWVKQLANWQEVEKLDAKAAAKESRDKTWKPNEKQSAVLASALRGSTGAGRFPKDNDLPMARHNKLSTLALIARGKLRRVEIGDSVEYSEPSKPTPPANVPPNVSADISKPAAKPRKSPDNSISADRDSLLVAIAKLGGMSTGELTSNGFDQKDITRPSASRISRKTGKTSQGGRKPISFGFNMPLHRKIGGLSFDGVLEALKQYGYFPESASVNDVIDAVRGELGGRTYYTPEAIDRQATMDADERNAELAAQQELIDAELAAEREIADSIELDAESEAAQDAIELFADDFDIDAPSASSDERAFLISMGMTEEEADAELNESRQAQPAGAGEVQAPVGEAPAAGPGEGGSQGVQGGKVESKGDSRPGLALQGQTPEEIKAASIAAEKAAHDELIAKAAEARKEKAAKDKAEKDRRAAEVLKEREAAKKAEVDKAAEEFALGQAAPEPVVKKVTTEEAKGQKDIFAAPADKPNPDQAAIDKANADFDDALNDLGDIIGKPFRANFTPEQEQKLIPVLTRLMDAAFRKGYYKFKEAARFVLESIGAKFGKDLADQITLQHLQGAYVGMSGRYLNDGADSIADVASIKARGELLGSTNAGVKPKSAQVNDNGGVTDTKSPANIAASQSERVERNSVGDIEALRGMYRLMVRAAKNKQILNSIVDLIPVDVMNMLGGQQLTPDALFNNPSMLENLAGLGGNPPIPGGVNAARSVVEATARFAAKSAWAKEFGSDSIDFDAALNTIKSRHGVTPNSDVSLGDAPALTGATPTIIQKGLANVTNERSGANLERDSQDANIADGVGAQVVPVGAGGNGGAGRPGVAGSGAEGNQPAGGNGLRDGEAAIAGERGNLEVHTGATKLSPGSAGNSVDLGGDSVGVGGLPIEPDAAGRIKEAARGGIQLEVAKAKQRAADKAPFVKGLEAIRQSLPILTEGQQEDVFKTETRFAVPDGYGMLFTNGTGTGKTFSALGVIKRFAAQGKQNILVVAPSQEIISAWQKAGKLLGLDLSLLEDINDAGSGMVITTYANMGANNELANRDWDLIVHDEAHYLSMNKDGTNTESLNALRAISLHPDGALKRAIMLHGDIRDAASIAQKQADIAARSDDARDWPMAKVHQARANKLNAEFNAKHDAIKADVAARQLAKRPRVMFLSATPFAYEKSVDWANGYLFDYNEGRGDERNEFRGYNAGSNSDQFMMQHFGYRMRYGKLTAPDAKVDSGLMQRQFNSWLKKSGSLSGRMLDVDADYDRRFILVDSAIGQRIDEALQWFDAQRKATNDKDRQAAISAVQEFISEKFDYLSRRYLLESIKAKEVVPHVREHLAMGRKVVVFHDYKKGGGFNPFIIGERTVKDQDSKEAATSAAEWNGVVGAFNAEFKDIINSDLFKQTSPILMFKNEFPGVLLFNGDVSVKDRRANVQRFQDDDSGPQVILVQSAAGKEGISLHDTTGKHQRVLFNLGQPTQPTTAIQQEGRIYRTGQVTDAIFRYLNTGTNWEKWAFATTIANRASAAENLGMGELARSLKDAFIAGFEESDNYRAGMDGEGKGGKERDKAANNALTEYDRARAFYFGTQKKNGRTKAQEGADYFATPEPVGLKMVEWANVLPGEKVLEPSAGHGAIARWMPTTAERTAVEPSMTLRPRLAMVFDGQIIDSDFESLNVVNKYDAIVMNPPFGSGGKTAIDHLAKAATHLRDGGRIVAMLPTGPAADKKFEKWFYEESTKPLKPLTTYTIDGKATPIYKGDTIESKATWAPSGVVTRVLGAVGNNEPDIMVKATAPEFRGAETRMSAEQIKMIQPTGKRETNFKAADGLNLVADIKMPPVTFERAGTAVSTRIVVIENSANSPQQINRDFSDVADINTLFDRLENMALPDRAKEPEPEAAAAPAKKEKAPPAKVGDSVTVNGNQYAIEIYTTNDGKDKRGIWMEEKEAKAINPRAFKSSKMRGTPAEGKFFVDEYWLNKRAPESSSRFSFAGQQSATADQFQLDRAKQLLADGANSNAVRQQTGWFKGVDGKWRYEIDDSGASLKAHGFGFGELLDALGKNLTLADVLDHPALFAAYPSIAGASVEAIDEKSQNNGELVTNDGGGFTIRVNAGLGEAKALSVMLHEIQHGIQNVEGFSSGGSPAYMAGFSHPQIRALENKISTLMTSNKPGKQIAQEVSSLNAKIAELRRENPYDAYRRLAGEVESRNVQQRQNFPADKRKYSDPLGTQDVAPEDVIVVFNGKDAKDAPAPFNTTRASALAAANTSPSDSAVYQMAQEGKPASEILAFLAKASRRPFNRVLAIALQKAGLQTSITVDPQGGWSVGNRSYAAKYAAAYSPKADKVALFTPREAERHVLHELTHAATLKAINAGGAAAMRMTALFKHIEKSGKLEGMYGMSTLDEFVAEVFSNPKFRAALESVPAPAGSTLKTAWDWFVRIVARVLGFQSNGPHTALDRALRDGVALMDENAAIRAQAAGGDDRYAIASDRLKATRLFHSTANEDAAKQILADGIIKPPELKNSRGKLTPVVGRSYASKSLETAGIYSLGGVWMGREHGPERWTGRSAGRYGYVFEVDSAGLGDVQPDEDIVGELAARAIERKVDGLYWLASLAKRHGTERQLRNAIDGYYADQAQLGKKLLKYMTDDQKITLLDDYGAHVANDGPMRVVRAWKIDKSRSKEIARDGSNLLDIGEQVYGEKLDAIRAADEAVRFNAADDLPPTITVDGVERPTTNSNGRPIHPTLEGVRNFWRWFGGSKVVDADGRPLVVYHGTSENFSRFNLNKLGSNTIGEASSPELEQSSRVGHWFSSSPTGQTPEKYGGGYLLDMPSYIRAESPMILGRLDDLEYMLKDGKKGSVLRREMQKSGQDAIVIERDSEFKGTSYIVFSGQQIKSATGNLGTFSPDDPDIRYNLAANWPTSALPQAKALRDTVATALRSDANTSWITPFNTQYHKAEKWAADGKPLFKRVFNLVQQFLGDVSKYAVMAQNAAPTLLHEWRTISDVKAALSGGDLVGRKHRADIAAVAMPLYDGTLYGGGNPLSGIKWSDERLRTKYKLTDRQIKLYHEALAAVNVSMDEMAKSVIAQHAKREKVGFDSGMDIDDMSAGVLSNLEDKKQEIMESVGEIAQETVNAQIADLKEMDRPDEADKLKREFDKAKKDAKADLERIDKTIGDINGIVAKNKALQAAGYFPLMRFGKHTVTARDKDGKVQFFGMYDGIPLVPGSGQAEANRVAAQLKEEFPDWDVKTDIVNDQKYKLYQGVNLDALQLFAEHMEKDDVEPFQEFVRMATNNRSAQRRLLHRKGTPGFDKDVRRTMAQFITSNARATSSNYHTQDMLRAAAEAEKDGGDIGAEAIKLVKYVQDPIEEAQALRGFLFFNFLGGSIASAMVNLTQTPAMTLPYLSKFEQAPALMRRTMAAARMAAGKPENIADQKLRDALMRAELDGVTAPQEIHQLMATAANNIFAGSRAANILLRGWGAPFAMAESFNRRIAFITAFKIGEGMGNSIKNKTGFDNAFDFAEDVVKQTQGIYNKGNRMNIGRGAVGATLLTFKQYSVMYLELLKRLPPKQRAIMVGVLLLSAGAGGLPGVDDLEDLWDTVGQWLGYATNSKRSIRNSLTEFAGAPIADVVLNGVLSRMGIDLHSRLGMQNLIPGTGILKQSSTDKGRDIEEFFGPAASVIKSAGDALENMATGRPGKAAMAVSPVAIRNAALGGKMAATGFAQDARGRNTVPVNEVEAFAKGIGFNPKSVAEFGSVKRDLAQDQRLVGVKREEFAAAMADAILNNDPEARLQAIKDLQEWNQNNPFHRVTITPESIAKRVRDARAEGATRMLRSLPKGMRTQAAEEFRQ